MSEHRQARPPRDNGGRLLEQLAQVEARSDPDLPAGQDREAIAERFRKTVATLQDMHFPGANGRTRSVDELPWYVLIGAPGSGESASLLGAGLRFPLLETDGEARIAGVGPTRNCSWWFTDEAVLLDTTGHYPADKGQARTTVAAWHDFLGLLKRYRPQQPLNGAIVTLSVTDLMLWSKKERYYFSGHLRMRLAELYAGLDARFPVYLVVTKMDLLAGFAEFFAALDANESAQVWGTTFALAADPAASARHYAEDFAALERRLYGVLVERLHQEQDLRRRATIYSFPQQFHALGPLLEEFLALAFAARVNDHPPMLRGVYFTSGMQEGTPIDRVMATLAPHFGLERAEPAPAGAPGRSFFVTRLLRDVIFAEAGLAVVDGPTGQGGP
ncbi:MAG: type VI secretion system membrane subunit TssM [Betaproteobacteria bacterium]|nr:type VI secretion system membrane subunit TssM [Betaproteobacteria bacterium]